MRRFLLQITAVVLVATLAGCGFFKLGGGETKTPSLPSPSVVPLPQTSTPPAQASLSDERLLNAEYLSPLLQVVVNLVDGKFSGVVEGSELNVTMQPGIAYGDLNADGVDDAALLLAESTGGTGSFVSLVVVYSKDDQFAQAQGVMIDDRPVIHALSIEDGVVKLEGLLHGPNDAMVNPTIGMRGEYTLYGGRMVLTRYRSAFGGGEEHAIYIEVPKDGDAVSGSVRVTGSMPIGPFENNLSLLIIDPLSGQLVHEGFMVQAEDMGAPATFDSVVALPDVPAGAKMLLVLSELSMADGAPMAVDAVQLIVGE